MDAKVLSPTELQLLSLITSERAGREVARLYENETGQTISYGTLCTTFRRMRERGLVQTRRNRDEDGRTRLFCATTGGLRSIIESRSYYQELAAFAGAVR